MTGEIVKQPEYQPKPGFSGMQVLGIVLASVCIAVVATAFVIKLYLFPSPFTPVELSHK
jgi:hypothetical protein